MKIEQIKPVGADIIRPLDENFRRMGVATKLINFCKQEAKNRDFDRLELDVWEFNEGAMRLYDSVGFKTYREYKEMNI